MSYRELLPGRHQPQLPLDVPELLKLTDVAAKYIGSGRWFLVRGGANTTSDAFPNYEDFVGYVQYLMQWECSNQPKMFMPLGSQKR